MTETQLPEFVEKDKEEPMLSILCKKILKNKPMEYIENRINETLDYLERRDLLLLFCSIDELLTDFDGNISGICDILLKYAAKNGQFIYDKDTMTTIITHVRSGNISSVREILDPVDKKILFNYDFNPETQTDSEQISIDEKITKLKKLIREYTKMEKIIDNKIIEFGEKKSQTDEFQQQYIDKEHKLQKLYKNMDIQQQLLDSREQELEKKLRELEQLEINVDKKINQHNDSVQILNNNMQTYEDNVCSLETKKMEFEMAKKKFYNDSIHIDENIKKKKDELMNIEMELHDKELQLDAREEELKKITAITIPPKKIIINHNSYHSLAESISPTVNKQKCCFPYDFDCVIS